MADELHKKRAVAMRYKMDEEAAPKVIAKGQGLLAVRIIELAEELLRRQYSERDVAGILGGNFMRVAEAVWK